MYMWTKTSSHSKGILVKWFVSPLKTVTILLANLLMNGSDVSIATLGGWTGNVFVIASYSCNLHFAEIPLLQL